MVNAYMQVDLNNPLAVKYHELSLKSFESVSDVFKIHVVQCITPDTLLDIKFDDSKSRSPQEKASLCSNYRMLKRIATGEKLWLMEHDAYLIPEREHIFRDYLKTSSTVCNPGIAMECYTTDTEIAQMFCDALESDSTHRQRGPMSILHWVADSHKENESIYWPLKGKDNRTGKGYTVTQAHRQPIEIIPAPITQLVDYKAGSTVIDRPLSQVNPIYTKKTHPNFHFISLD